eukprot:TRINITY_DN1058_c0_g1_i6.p3 TRINITY_DN1058_c0_g1~~TRINITY_DN1058_c0_g1_i6.p3  ORF type:complete len:168 (+),score=23.44 TRINITY_DN1058_c0_g1_i6:74-577(+)
MDENTADTPLVSLEGQDALITRVLKGVGLVIFMVVMIGTGFGIPALGPIMVEAGVFNNTCVATNSTSDQFLGTDGNNTINVTECVLSQEKHIARATSITVRYSGYLYFFPLFSGFSSTKMTFFFSCFCFGVRLPPVVQVWGFWVGNSRLVQVDPGAPCGPGVPRVWV